MRSAKTQTAKHKPQATNNNFFFAFCLLLFALCSNSCKETPHTSSTNSTPISGKEVYTDSSSSSVKVFNENGKVCIQQSNTYYELIDAYEGTARIPLLLKIKKTELCFADSLNKHKVYEVYAKSVMDTKTIEWSNYFVATNLEFKDNTILAVHEGVDSEEDFLKRFSLLDGKEVFSSSYSEVKVAIPNVKDKRFIGYTSKKAATAPLKDLKTENLLGIVRYGSSTGAVNAFKIVLKRSKVAAKIPTYTPDIVLEAANANTTIIEDGKSVILMKADEHYQKEEVKDFSVKLTFYYGDDNEATEIVIPVSSDRLDISFAKYDKDIFQIEPF